MNFHSLITSCLYISLCFITACSGTSEEELSDIVTELENVTIHERNPTPASQITFIETVAFKNSEEVPLGAILEVNVDDSGNVYIIEYPMRSEGIYVFDSEGTFINKIGRKGRGPGEFQALIDIDITRDQIFTLDGALLRIQIFSTETHDLMHEANLDPSQWVLPDEQSHTFPEKLHVLNDSTILGVFNHTNSNVDTRSYYHMDLNGNVISEQLLTQDFIKKLETTVESVAFNDPFGGRGLMAISAGNQIYTVWSEEILFKIYDSEGIYIRAFYHPFENSNLSRDEAISYNFREGIPEHWRAFEHFLIDDESNLWISTITDDREIYEWWIMDSYGNLQAKFEWPQSKEIKKVKNGFAYALVTEEETGLQEVIKYRIQWNN